MSKNKILDLDDLDDNDKYNIYTTTVSSSTHNIYLSEAIEDNTLYHELINKTRGFGKKDIVNFYLSCPGGHVSTGHQLINAVRECEARVNMIVDAPCFSMASILALSGDSLSMRPKTYLMFHNYSGGTYGKGPDIPDAAAATQKWIYGVFEDVAFPFLNKKELDRIKNNRDIYIFDNHKNNVGADSKITTEARIKRHFKK
jgi:ATP-dependent protease ClpP protease subunit